MTEQHPITPPQWRVVDWYKQAMAMGADVDAIFLEVFRAGADEELEACCEEMKSIPSPLGIPFGEMASNALRNARRPKPKSQAEEALKAIGVPTKIGEARVIEHHAHELIRAALKRLQELENNND